ncbi:MAG: hypothetical protein AMS18_08605 [Gemmatimonas sp. SG8_17]|nr:MAG: hypothetical protein AMS18_08605 [Gemmatimonas sp. SG8_17]
MTRQRSASILMGLAALGFLGTAAVHTTGYGTVLRLAAEVPSDLGPAIPALWLVFSLDLAVIGLIVAVVAWRPQPIGRWVLVIASLSPLGAAGLQLRFIGFVPPTALLLGIGVLTLVAAALLTSQATDGASAPH